MTGQVLSLRQRLGLSAIAGALGFVYPSHPAIIIGGVTACGLTIGLHAWRRRA